MSKSASGQVASEQMDKSAKLQSEIPWMVAAGVLDGTLAVAWGYAWRIPFMPDMLGTALVALRWGPGAAALAAVAASGLEALLVDPSRLAFLPVRLLAALILGYGARAGWAAQWRRVLLLSLGQGIAMGITAGFIQVLIFRGFSGEPLADLLTALASLALPPVGAALTIRLATGIVGALVNNLLALRLLSGQPWRLLPGLWGRAAAGLVGVTLAALLALSLPVRLATSPDLPGPLALPALAVTSSDPATPTVAQLHLSAGEQDTAICIACHGDKRDEFSLQPDIPSPHSVHLNSLLLNFGCTDCHISVDWAQEAAAGLRRQVDVTLCSTCHSTFPAAMPLEYQDMDCLACHPDWRARMAGMNVVNLDAVTPDDCAGCHGGRAWYQIGEEVAHK